MTTIYGASELLRRALAYLDEQRLEKPHLPLSALIDDAGRRFNLGPADADSLERLYQSDRRQTEKDQEMRLPGGTGESGDSSAS